MLGEKPLNEGLRHVVHWRGTSFFRLMKYVLKDYTHIIIDEDVNILVLCLSSFLIVQKAEFMEILRPKF